MKTRIKKGGGNAAQLYRHPLCKCINPYVACLWAIEDPARRQVLWRPDATAMVAVLMALEGPESLRDRFQEAKSSLAADVRIGGTYNGWIKALHRQAPLVLPMLKQSLRRRVLRELDAIAPEARWRLLAVDGTREMLPRTTSNEAHFGIADNGRCPQAYTTAVVEVHTGLLWDWRIDRAGGSEKDHLVQMSAALPERCLLLGDGNFVGYRVWSTLHKDGHSFLIRVGGNVHLLSMLWPEVKIERRGDIVYAWPASMQHKVPPLRLRLVGVGGPGERVYLLTNVLDRRQLSNQAAGTIYRLRWGAELFYRTFKQTLGFSKLASRSACRAELELEWALIGCCIMMLLGAAAARKRRVDPHRLSPAGMIRVLRGHLRNSGLRSSCQTLRQSLACCLMDTYRRQAAKASRYRPTTKNTPKTFQLQPPRIRKANAQERKLAHKHYSLAA